MACTMSASEAASANREADLNQNEARYGERLRTMEVLVRVCCDLAQLVEHGSGDVKLLGLTHRWIQHHKNQDRIREEHEKRALLANEAKRTALGKLTAEDRKALGL